MALPLRHTQLFAVFILRVGLMNLCRLVFKFLYSQGFNALLLLPPYPWQLRLQPVPLGWDKKTHILWYSKPTFSNLSLAKTNKYQSDMSLECNDEDPEARQSLHLTSSKPARQHSRSEPKTPSTQFSGALRIKQRPDYETAVSLCY